MGCPLDQAEPAFRLEQIKMEVKDDIKYILHSEFQNQVSISLYKIFSVSMVLTKVIKAGMIR